MKGKSILLRCMVTLGCGSLLVVASCSKQPSGNGGKASGTVREVRLGGVLSLTGPAATMGGESLNGLKLAIEDINARGKVHLDLRLYDDKTDPNEAAKLIQQVVQVDRVQTIVGPSTSPNCLRAGRLIQDLAVPAMTPTATNAGVTQSGEYMSRVCFIDPFQGEALARFARKDLGLRSAELIVDKANDYSVGLADSFRSTFKSLGGEIVGEMTYSTGDADFAALIAKAARSEAQVLVIPGWYSDVGLMLRQAGRKWDKFTLLGGDAWDSPQLFELSGGNIHNAYISTHYAVDEPNPRVQEFVSRYVSVYKVKPGGFAALGYDTGLALEDAILRAKNLTPAAIKDAINSIRGLQGVTGEITLNSNRDAVKPATIVEVLPHGYRFKTRISS
ncbi:MAG: branched-chain amino acid transport system substrate-binding protein [Acidobacteriota bacterium]|nr:branched-chain amino acid transport system substrate-binding protein [Acidobacteriota bacterium]